MTSKNTSNGRPPGLRATMSLADMNPNGNNGNNNSFGGNGNNREKRDSFATSEEFVRKFGGKRAINKVLIANNGIAGKCTNKVNSVQ